MIEADRLWCRWDDARQAGTLPDQGEDESRVLPGDQKRYDALTTRITAELAALRPTLLVRGEFDYRQERVKWTPIAHARGV